MKKANTEALWKKFEKQLKRRKNQDFSNHAMMLMFGEFCWNAARRRRKKKLKKEEKKLIDEVLSDCKIEGIPAIFLDRDGVLNRRAKDHCYVRFCSDLKRRMFPNVESNIRILKKLGYLIIIISNQAGINKGLIDPIEYNKMVRYVTSLGVDSVYTCPHNYLKESCDCRKPSPKMIFMAAQQWGIDVKESWMVGDDDTDMLAGKAAGCKTYKGNLEEFMATSLYTEVKK